jgi:hypothetical protein
VKKIVSLFARNYDGDRLVRDEVVPGSEWVIAGEGIATRKYDGTCCMVRDGRLYKRHDVKKGRATPDGFEPAQEPDATTGHWPGWLPVGDGPEDRWHREAFARLDPIVDGSYELCGPKVQGNAETRSEHVLIAHGSAEPLHDAPRTFAALREYLRTLPCEGIVWHHPDGRMVKLKVRDFGFQRATDGNRQ